MFKRVSKLRTNKITGGVLLNQKMTPQMLSTEENRQKGETETDRGSHGAYKDHIHAGSTDPESFQRL